MDRRFKALLIAALLCTTTALTACGEDASTNDSQDPPQTETTDEEAAKPLDAPALAKLAKAPNGTANAEDARLANDVLLLLVADRNVDAQHFAIVVDQGVLYLMPNQDAEDAEIDYVKEQVQNIDGIAEVKVQPTGEPAQAPDAATQEIVAAIEHANTPESDESDEDATEQPDHHTLTADAPTLHDAAEIAKPADDPDDANLAEQSTQDDDTPNAEDTKEEEDTELREYTLRRGDSLSTVAARKLGNGARWTEIYQLNRDVIGPNPDGVRDGMTIKLPPR